MPSHTPVASPTPPPHHANKKQKEPKAQKQQPPAAPTSAPDKAEVTLNSLDLRVGRIVSVEKHATADKLYCEMIDIGEAEPRAIASGLVHHYSLEEMHGRRLIVVANLKPRNLVGFKSNGMVLCAAKTMPDGSEKVEFIDPPVQAAVGHRVVCGSEGLVTAALSASQVDKQKAFEAVAVDLKVDGQGNAVWRGEALYCVGMREEACVAPTLRECVIR